jgi:hypothetical protein
LRVDTNQPAVSHYAIKHIVGHLELVNLWGGSSFTDNALDDVSCPQYHFFLLASREAKGFALFIIGNL